MVHAFDKVEHAGVGQKRSWHGELMPCHGMAWFPSIDDAMVYHFLSDVLGRVERDQWSTNDDLMGMV